MNRPFDDAVEVFSIGDSGRPPDGPIGLLPPENMRIVADVRIRLFDCDSTLAGRLGWCVTDLG